MTPQKTLLSGLILSSSLLVAFGDPVAEGSEKAPGKSVTVSDTEIKLPGVTVNRETLEVRIEATVCLKSGILEYVVCMPNTFEHESIFTTEATPELVHAALLLGGLKPTPLLVGLTDLWWEKALNQEDSRVKVEVEWEEEGAEKRINLISMLRNREEIGDGDDPAREGKKAAVQDAWVFTGSFLQTNEETGERFYTANLSGILVGIWPDPSTVIQYGIANGNPYEGNFGMEINEERVPKVGTKVNLVFSRLAASKKAPPETPASK